MNSLKNKVNLIGNLGKEVIIKTTKSGKKVARFPLATNEVYKDKEGALVKETVWHSIVAWGKQAELMSLLLSKGTEVAIEGQIKYGSYQDQEGLMRYTTEIVASTFQKLSRVEMTI